MEELNLTEILKDAPIGTKLYSPICGEAKLSIIDIEHGLLWVEDDEGHTYRFAANGKYLRSGNDNPKGEPLLWPNKFIDCWAAWGADWVELGPDVMRNENLLYRLGCSASEVAKWATANHGVMFRDVVNGYFYGAEDIELVLLKEHGHQLTVPETYRYRRENDDLKPFDRVIVRNSHCGDTWNAAFFSHYERKDVGLTERYRYAITTDGAMFDECLPYTEELARYLGTRTDLEGADLNAEEEEQ